MLAAEARVRSALADASFSLEVDPEQHVRSVLSMLGLYTEDAPVLGCSSDDDNGGSDGGV